MLDLATIPAGSTEGAADAGGEAGKGIEGSAVRASGMGMCLASLELQSRLAGGHSPARQLPLVLTLQLF